MKGAEKASGAGHVSRLQMSYRVVFAAQAAAHVSVRAAAAEGEGVPAPLLVLPPDVVVQTALPLAEGVTVAAEEPVCTAAAVPLGVDPCVAVVLPALVADADTVPVGDGGSSTSLTRRCTPPPHIASHGESMRQSLYRQTRQSAPAPGVALPLADALPLALELGVGSAVRLVVGLRDAQPWDAGCTGLTAGVGAALTLGATLLGSEASTSHRNPTYPVSSSVMFPSGVVFTSKCT
jgi:hypothetical protein